MNNHKDWNPDAYLQFKSERTLPAIDLVSRIACANQPRTIIDIGCGPGNSGQALINRWPDAHLLGIDSSAEMIKKAQHDYPQHEWINTDASSFRADRKFDIVFSNAAIQWIPDHDALLTSFVSMLTDNGVVAFQIPLFKDMPVGMHIEKVSSQSRWKQATAHCSGLFTYHDYRYYYDVLSQGLASIEMWITEYIHVLDSQQAIIEWIKSTGLKPYLDCLPDDSERAAFTQEIFEGIRDAYQVQNNGKVFFPFRRLFVVGYKSSR